MASGSQHVADIDKMVFVKENWFQKKAHPLRSNVYSKHSLFKRQKKF
jgi:hypothetical protein